jgi:hypothetical protein
MPGNYGATFNYLEAVTAGTTDEDEGTADRQT